MKNPFRSEAEAFRLVIGAVVYFGAIAIAIVAGGRWWGLGVFVVLSAAVAVWILRREARERPTVAPRRRVADDEERILVVANETVAGEALREAVREAVAGGRANVLVVVPGPEQQAQALDFGRGPGPGRGRGATRPQHRGAGEARYPGPGRGRRRRPGPGDRGRAPDLRARPDRHLHPPSGPVELARARRRHLAPASASRCRSRTSSSTSRPRPSRTER